MLAVAAISCDASMLLPSGNTFPTAAPGAVETIVAGTAGAAQTQTAALLPPTATSTFTPTATRTPSLTPSFTPTFLWLLKTATPIRSATPTEDTSMSSADFACRLIAQDPDDGARLNASASFDAVWEVRNIGQKNWAEESIDFVYVSGRKMHEEAAYDLAKTVKVGSTIDLVVDMVAPNKSGDYSTEWALSRSGNTFCHVTLDITVK